MSETSILPGAAPSTDSGIDMVPPGTGVEESEGGDRRKLMIIGAVVGVIVLAAAAYLLLHKGSSSSDQPFVPHSTSTGVTAPAPETSAPAKSKSHGSSSKPSTLPKKAKNANVRDPFTALVLPPAAATGTGTTTTTVTPTTAPTTGGTTGGTQPTPAPSSSTTGGGATSGGPLWIQLMAVHGSKATFDVGYAHHKFRKFIVSAPSAGSNTGTVFDKIFALINITNGSATVQIGDDTPFDLTTGVSHVAS